ncbi:MAG: hypothetical protein HQL14_02915 [Candidatus Omnitrophica bacterium]|nr:hypothetical protein [Candidatus Omnitrophota bacterium]
MKDSRRMNIDTGDYESRSYEMDKTTLEGMGLSASEYERAIKEMCNKNGY